MKTSKSTLLFSAILVFASTYVLLANQPGQEKKKKELPFTSSVQIPYDKSQKGKKLSKEERITRQNYIKSIVTVSPEQAKIIALTQAPNGTVKEVELDTERGNVFYEVEIKDGENEVEVIVDPGNSSILHVSKEEDDDDDDK
jgi:uncharacterized membrane protein YkoI